MQRARKTLSLVAGILAAPVLGGSVEAAVLMVDFGPTAASGTRRTNTPYHTATPGFTDTTWNTVETADVSSLLYSNGAAATGVSLNLGAVSNSGTTINLGTQPSTASGLGSATNTGVYGESSVAKDAIFHGATGAVTRTGAQFTGLEAGTYEVFVTARNTNAGSTAASQSIFVGAGVAGENFNSADLDSATLTYATQTTAVNAWAEVENYLKFTVTLAEGQALNVAAAGFEGTSPNRGFLNSIQIAPAVPEPAALGLLGLGGLMLVRRRRA